MESNPAIKSLAALAQETRLRIFRLLVEAGPDGMPVGAIMESVGAAPATMSFHLKELANAGLISARQDGRFIYYSAEFEQINELLGFLTQNCCAKSGARCYPQPATSRRGRPATRRSHA